MKILLITTFLCAVGVVACIVNYIFSYNSNNKTILLLLDFFIILLISTLAWEKSSNEIWNSKAEKIAPLYEELNFSKSDDYIYRDVESNKYFILEENPWNPIKPNYRKYLDNKTVEEYIEAYNFITTQTFKKN